jgi:hypothetical protein
MTVEIYFYVLTDECGNRFWVVYGDHCSTIHIGGYSEDGLYHAFDNEARYCWEWAEKNNFKLKFIAKEIELP